MSGNLYIVSTPIGNLEDISFRALKVLKDVDIIAAEDSRVSRRILEQYKIKNTLRLTIGSQESNKLFIKIIGDILK